MRLNNKVAIITGSGRGIGKAVAKKFGENGVNVVITSRSEEENRQTRDEIRDMGVEAIKIEGDVTVEEDVKKIVNETVKKFGQVDVLVNNAGIAGPMTDVASMPLEGWNKTLATNLTGTMLFTREVVPHMIDRQRGVIINISSNVARRGVPERTPYVSSKWAQIGFTQTVAHEVAEDNIRVNAVCPGAVEGERIETFLEYLADKRGTSLEEARNYVEQEALLNRMVTQEEVANTVLFLVSENGSGITGQSINVTAGTVFS